MDSKCKYQNNSCLFGDFGYFPMQFDMMFLKHHILDVIFDMMFLKHHILDMIFDMMFLKHHIWSLQFGTIFVERERE
ncbi:MAG: hypothetical protein LBT50_11195 [Prevotellaceae bacterium]|nr:hypothetical protein [Prevotellaceae bacterium]